MSSPSTSATSTTAVATPVEHAASDVVVDAGIGAVAGMAEVTVNQPLIYFKNSIQTGAKIASNPAVWYRGYLTNVGTLAPITAIQVSATTILSNVLFGKAPSQANDAEKSISAVGAGALSGLISGPSESIILHQQRTGEGTFAALKSIRSDAGWKGVFRGTSYAMFRDGLFTAGFMAGAPMLVKRLRDDYNLSEPTARLAGGCAAGALAAVLTHPADTIKTRLQRDYMGEKYKSFTAPYAEGGLLKGLAARGTRVIVGVCVIGNVTEFLQNKWAAYSKSSTDKPVATKSQQQ